MLCFFSLQSLRPFAVVRGPPDGFGPTFRAAGGGEASPERVHLPESGFPHFLPSLISLSISILCHFCVSLVLLPHWRGELDEQLVGMAHAQVALDIIGKKNPRKILSFLRETAILCSDFYFFCTVPVNGHSRTCPLI